MPEPVITFVSAPIPAGVEPSHVHKALGKSAIGDHAFATTARVLSIRVVDGDVSQAQLDAAVAAADSQGALKTARLAAKAEVARQAMAEYDKLSPPGLLGVRLAKEDEAKRHAADPAPDPANYPLMNERAIRKGLTLVQVRTQFLAKAAAWRARARDLEAAREAAEDAIEAAASETQVAAVLQSLAWPP